jgi:hypothetical protein
MARRKEQRGHEVDAVVDYTSHGIKPRGPQDGPIEHGRTNPRHDYLTRVRLDNPVQVPEHDGPQRWRDLEATAAEYAADRHKGWMGWDWLRSVS